jgi:hypothetical protein
MKARDSSSDKAQRWTPPTLTKLPIGKETKSVVAGQRSEPSADVVADIIAEPQAPALSGPKFGFSFEWSFPISVRND